VSTLKHFYSPLIVSNIYFIIRNPRFISPGSPLNYIPGYDPAYRLRSLTCSGEVVFEDRENI